MFKLFSILGLFFLIFFGCSESTVDIEKACSDSVTQIREMQVGLFTPEHLRRRDTKREYYDFNVKSYFDVLTEISIIKGYKLDYVYFGDHPILYAQDYTQKPYDDLDDYIDSFDSDLKLDMQDLRNYYLNFIEVKDSILGYFQYLVLYNLADKFYLIWHGFYNDVIIICSYDQLIDETNDFRNDGLFNIPDTLFSQALDIDFTPMITMENNSVTIRIVTFGKWEGIIEKVYEISRTSPHILNLKKSDVLVDYDCNVLF